MITICKHFTFDAAHRLPRLPPTHKCHRMHGHTYGVDIELHGEPDTIGFVVDYAVIAEAWGPVHDLLDHRYLNDVEGLPSPTTEWLAVWIFDRMCGRKGLGDMLLRVRVSESSSTWAELAAHDYGAAIRAMQKACVLPHFTEDANHVAGVDIDRESVQRGGSARAAWCSCGWNGPQRATLAMAADDAASHERDPRAF